METPRLILRKHTENDWKDLFGYLSLPQTYIFEPGEPIDSTQAKRLAKERSKGTHFLAVELKENRKMIGHLYFKQIPPDHFMTWELGFIFNPAYHNKGYCTEAAKKLIEYAFQELNAHRIIAYCNIKNIASWRVLEKIGMRREALNLQKGYFRKDEKGSPLWFDSYQYAILNNLE